MRAHGDSIANSRPGAARMPCRTDSRTPCGTARETGGPWFLGQCGFSYCETSWAAVANGFRAFPITVPPEVRR